MFQIEHKISDKFYDRVYLMFTGSRFLTYLRRNLQASLPVIVLSCAIYFRNGFSDWALLLAVLVSVSLSFIYAKIYIEDADAVSAFIAGIAEGKAVRVPDVSVLSNMDAIVDAVNIMYVKWCNQQLSLKSLAAETKVLFDIIPDAMVVVDATCRVTHANNMSREKFGFGISRRKITGVVEDAIFATALRRALSKGRSEYLEVDAMDLCGEFYSIVIEPLTLLGSKASALVLFRSITDQKNRDRIHSDFIANAGHEMRTPLTTVFGFIETLKMGGIDPELQSEFLDIMSSQCIRIKELLSDMEQLYSMDSCKQDLVKGVIDLDDLVRNVARGFAAETMKHNMRISVICTCDEPALISGDNNEIRSIFLNLISNAIKYCYRSSELKIFIHDAICRGGLFIRVRLVDQGAGINARDIPRLTERFYRTDESHSSTIPGSGLGLAIVRSAAERHEGWLEISSVVGQGSEFTVFLPSLK